MESPPHRDAPKTHGLDYVRYFRAGCGYHDGIVADADELRYRRLNAPLVYRQARLRYVQGLSPLVEFGGLRVYSDDAVKVGRRLELDILLPGELLFSCLVDVAWVNRLPPEGPARYELGLRFLQLPREGIASLESCLEEN